MDKDHTKRAPYKRSHNEPLSARVLELQCFEKERLEATPGFEPGNKGFADPRLTTWPRRRSESPSKSASPENGPSARLPDHPLLGTTRSPDYSGGLLGDGARSSPAARHGAGNGI